MMTEEILKELKKNGYSVHKKMDEKWLKRRNEIYFKLSDRLWGSDYVYYNGKILYIYEIRARTQAVARRKMKELYGSLKYQEIPDEDWPKIKMEVIQAAKDYIDKRCAKECR